jgi:L-iditol 2-dehydrogenase
MRAAVFEALEKITVREVEMPLCEDDGILVKVESCGICGGDIRNFHNGLKTGVFGQVMGHEASGTVAEAGKNVRRFKKGDIIATAPDISCGECYFCKRGLVNLCQNHRMLGTHFPGGFAEYMYLNDAVLSRGFVEHVPEGMSFEYAAFAEKVAAVYACQKRVNVSLGDSVVIIGDGPVGCLHVEIARARGAAKIILIGLDKLSLAERFQPDLIVSNKAPEKAARAVLDATGGIGADIVISAVPSVKPQQQALEMVRKRGLVVIYGGVPPSASLSVLDSNRIHYNEITVTGAFSYPATGLQDALSCIQEGKVDPGKYITDRVPLEGIVEGMQKMESGQALNVMVKPWE